MITSPTVQASDAFTRHVEELVACRGCPAVAGRPVTGPVFGTKVLLVGQAPGPREESFGRPFAYTAGKKLFSWFADRGISEEEFRQAVYMAAVIRCFPGRDPKAGGDRVPAPDEIQRCGQHLDREIALLQPSLIILVGTLAAQQFLDESTLSKIVGQKFRASRAGQTFDLVVLPHPSGRSTWLNKKEHANLLEQSLNLITQHLAFMKEIAKVRKKARS